ncbi:MAG: hypothetical protein ACK5Z5_04280 [Neisseriaceae bacterium]
MIPKNILTKETYFPQSLEGQNNREDKVSYFPQSTGSYKEKQNVNGGVNQSQVGEEKQQETIKLYSEPCCQDQI